MKYKSLTYLSLICVICLFIDNRMCLENKINTGKILSDSFLKEINKKQKIWKADRNFHINSEIKNILSIHFERKFKLQETEIEVLQNISEINTFDSRKKWSKCNSIKGIKTQGNCASGYVIVPASVFSDRLCIQRNIKRTNSADQLLSCCRKCGAGCFGGFAEQSFTYMAKVGLVSGGGYRSNEGCRPYLIEKCQYINNLQFCGRIRKKTPSCYYLRCTNIKYDKEVGYDHDKIKIKKIYRIPKNVTQIKSDIFTRGPVSASLTIYEDFMNYKSGVYFHTIGSKIGQHEVKLIGWGKTKRKKIPYWIATNSWSSRWGDRGAFKIKMGVNECDIESNVLAGSF